jgi:hypothetical protein
LATEYARERERQETARQTAAHRAALAERHELRADEARRVARAGACSVLSGRLVKRVRPVRERLRGGGVRLRKVVSYVTEAEAAASSERWNRDRARGQRMRFVNAAHCGEGTIQTTCGECGEVKEQPALCGAVRVCETCWTRRARRWRRTWKTSYVALVAELKEAGYFAPWREGGPYGERHLVLTFPHVVERDAAGDVDRWATAARRIKVLFDAWALFRRWIDEYYTREVDWTDDETGEVKTKRKRLPGACYYRGFEWTVGADGMGHPHFHVWMMGPWLPLRDDHERPDKDSPLAALYPEDGKRTIVCEGESCALCAHGAPKRTGLVTAWARALGHCGVEVDAGELHVKLRKVWSRHAEFVREIKKDRHVLVPQRTLERVEVRDSAGEDVIEYMETWSLAKLTHEEIERAGPDVLAAVYCELEGRRLAQGSKVVLPASGELVGLMGLAELVAPSGGCPCCVHDEDDGTPVKPRSSVVTPWFRVRDGPVATVQGPSLTHGETTTEHEPASDRPHLAKTSSTDGDLRSRLVDLLVAGGGALSQSRELEERLEAIREDPSLLGGSFAWEWDRRRRDDDEPSRRMVAARARRRRRARARGDRSKNIGQTRSRRGTKKR